jgi:predicted TIM-barrel fold metal-dependent hydrolase
MSAAATRGTVDWDTHFWQPPDLWVDRIDAKYRDTIAADISTTKYIPPAARAKMEIAMKIRGGDHADARLEWMDGEGIEACVVYPSQMAYLQYLPERAHAAAACRALNEWSAEFASAAPDRLFPCLLLPWYDPELALAEFERARSLDFRLAFSTPTPSLERRWSDPAYDPLWSAMQDTGTVMTFHEFTRVPEGEGRLVARPTYRDSYAMSYLCGHTVEIQLSLMDVTLGGVCDRFPRLVFGFVEAHSAWLPGWLSMLDSVWERPLTAESMNRTDSDLPPSGLFKRQGYVVAFPDDRDLELVIAQVGAKSVVVGSDYPHPQTAYGLVETFERANPNLTADVRETVLVGNADWILDRKPAPAG